MLETICYGKRKNVMLLDEGPICKFSWHYLAMDCTGDTVVEFGVQLGKLVAGVDARLGDVPHSSSFDNVPDHELPDRLVLGDALGAVGATNILDVTSAVLVSTVVATLRGHPVASNYSEGERW